MICAKGDTSLATEYSCVVEVTDEERLDQEILAQGWHFGEAIPAPALLQLIASKATVKDPGWVVT